jgi:hypothetical protein
VLLLPLLLPLLLLLAGPGMAEVDETCVVVMAATAG